MIHASFDSTKTALQDLLAQAHNGKLQLPDFQRGWVWDDDRIKGLLASVSVSFPIGAIMLLETGGEHVRFKPHPLAGTQDRLRTVKPETLILDGQQRLTSLYQALMGQTAVETKDSKNKPILRWYYIDMKKAVEAEDDREDAVLSVPEAKLTKSFGGEITLEVTTPEREYAADLFPVNRIFGSADWRQAYSEHWNFDREKMRLFNDFERDVIKRFEQYQIPVIELKKETPKVAVCLVFERVNTGGMALTVFELLTASFAADNFQLRDDWNAREKRLKENPDAGWPGEQGEARKLLTHGRLYRVAWNDIGSSRTIIGLVGVKGRFNSVLFEPVASEDVTDAEAAEVAARTVNEPAKES